jgi:uncharacterized protein with von Willebrand factor type A (vWA) domain
MHERPTEQLLRNVTEVYAAINAFTRALIPQVQAAARAFNDLGQQLQRAGFLDEHGQATKRPDRPAWLSPYGPPTRRR